jgi:hypothetical protein
MIWDVHPDPDFFFIPDTDPGPRVKKAPDSGSATLTTPPPPPTLKYRLGGGKILWQENMQYLTGIDDIYRTLHVVVHNRTFR